MSQLVWQKSSFSGTDPNRDCVELAAGPDGSGSVLIRESDDPGVMLSTGAAGLGSLLAGVKAGDFDRVAARVRA